MPYKDKSRQREYQRLWMKDRRAAWVRENGPCQKCGSGENLEVDHKDHNTKTVHTSQIWSLSTSKRTKELANCWVLCKACHLEKSREDLREIATGRPGAPKKLNEALVREIRAMVRERRLSFRGIARYFGVTHSVISDIVYGRIWAHVI